MGGIIKEFEEVESDVYNACDAGNMHNTTGTTKEYEEEV